MLFNSFEFAILLIITFALYWLSGTQKLRNLIMLSASYIFYGFWDWRFLSLIVISSLADFIIGEAIYKQNKRSRQRLLLFLSLFINLGILGFFKYFNFFIDSFVQLATQFGMTVHNKTIHIILPVGISFYTFQTLSYTIDIYKGKLKPTKNILSFFTFVAFFPQLVAGPIERASNLLPQFKQRLKFDRLLAEDGLKQMLWGFFKKIVIADNAAIIVNDVFGNYQEASPLVLLIGVFLFSFQIYADFSGYSDIALGIAKLFGINLTINFKTPYFATSIVDFWHRWHITLSTWFRDYVYIPLGGSKKGIKRFILSIFATFILSGLWHGANMTFITWGFIHALLYLIQVIFQKRVHISSKLIKLPAPVSRILKIIFVFSLVMTSWVFFRSESLNDAFMYIKYTFCPIENPAFYGRLLSVVPLFSSLFFISILIITEWFTQDKQHPLKELHRIGYWRYAIYLCIILIIFLFAPGEKSDFIYFQF
ncbi:MAG TPA: MBOAT family O-acyltransferase [Prolixibacteraceae bacterium]|nr:MBOAT family O-acyltransferase [Prolixibacteraceae bacterium]